MLIEEVQPHIDPRWAALVESHPHSSVFHTPEWLEALRRTYDYQPVAFISGSTGRPPTSGMVFCRVESWLSGRRLVSLPFSDHCEPLADEPEEFRELLSEARRAASELKYLELRPQTDQLGLPGNFHRYSQCYLHTLDLTPTIDEIYRNLHKDSIQRKIRRSKREGLTLDQGRSDRLLREFYTLQLLTRRRHGLPPQPFAWFRNLADCFGARLTVRVARVGRRPIASILTLRHKQTLVYKYGCSDARFHAMGGMARLFWQAIQDAKSQQLRELDLGRSEESHTGVIRFKERLGARRIGLTYWRWSAEAGNRAGRFSRSSVPGRVLSRLPDGLFRLAGEVFYRHAG